MKTMLAVIAVVLSCLFTLSTFAEEKIHTYIPDGGELPTIVTKTDAEYPEEAYDLAYEGYVYVKVALDKNGKQIENKIEVIKNKSKNEKLEEAAIAAVKNYEFTPAKIDGKAVSYWQTIPVKFTLPMAAKTRK